MSSFSIGLQTRVPKGLITHATIKVSFFLLRRMFFGCHGALTQNHLNFDFFFSNIFLSCMLLFIAHGINHIGHYCSCTVSFHQNKILRGEQTSSCKDSENGIGTHLCRTVRLTIYGLARVHPPRPRLHQKVVILRHSLFQIVGGDVMTAHFAAVSAVTVVTMAAMIGGVLALVSAGMEQVGVKVTFNIRCW